MRVFWHEFFARHSNTFAASIYIRWTISPSLPRTRSGLFQERQIIIHWFQTRILTCQAPWSFGWLVMSRWVSTGPGSLMIISPRSATYITLNPRPELKAHRSSVTRSVRWKRSMALDIPVCKCLVDVWPWRNASPGILLAAKARSYREAPRPQDVYLQHLPELDSSIGWSMHQRTGVQVHSRTCAIMVLHERIIASPGTSSNQRRVMLGPGSM